MIAILPRLPVYTLWLVWMATATAALIVKPWGNFGWDEWLVITVPLMLLHPRARHLDVLVVGLITSGLVWFFLKDNSAGWSELACLWSALAAGTVVAYTATRGSRDRKVEPDNVLPLADEDTFFDALNRELCRARRDEGSFAVLSVDRHVGQGDASLGCVCELLDTEMRAYADIAQVGERVLVLVPEVGDSQHEPLLKRLQGNAESSGCGELRIGLARFPQDAVCADDLIDLADRKRLVRGVSPIRGVSHVSGNGQVAS
ncbi:MAG: hypothetical protein V7746_00920 [Halioglobus sp.]